MASVGSTWSGKVREALAQGDKAIVADATSPAGHALRGDALLALGQSNEAVTAYERRRPDFYPGLR